MEYFLVFILIIVIIILASRRPRNQGESLTITTLNRIITEVIELRNEVRQLKQEVNSNTQEVKQRLQNNWQAPQPEPKAATTEPIAPSPEIPVATVHTQPVEVFEPAPAEAPVVETIQEVPAATQATETFAADENSPEATTPPEQTAYKQPAWEPSESKMDKWLRNNPDLEKFIGENLINKIGIAILVLGIAFFVKYAIDKEWINEVGRVCIGFACGAILVSLAHYLHKNYRSFSSVLAGGGIAVFYFTIAFGFHQYHLMPQSAAFVVMVGITAFAILLSVLYNRLELAVIATIGGFLAPFMVSTGEGNYIVLFTYLIILNIGILSLAYFKRWPAINIIALAFTEIIFGGWLSTVLNNPAKHFSYPIALSFASAFYFIFLGMNMVNQVKNKEHFNPFDFIILLVISSTYFGAGITMLHYWNAGTYQGLFTLALGLVNLALAWYVYKKGKADRNLLFLLIGITLTFITLTIPIQLHGHAITLFWSAEFVLLFWLSEYSGIRIFKYSSMLICLCTLVSLVLDWEKACPPGTPGLIVIYNNIQGLVTNIVATAAFAALYVLMRKSKETEIAGFGTSAIARLALIVSVGLLYATCMFGVNLYFHSNISFTIPNVYHRFITEAFAMALVIAMKRKHTYGSKVAPVAALVICFLFFVGSTDSIMELRDNVLGGTAGWQHFLMQWGDSVLLGVMFYQAINSIRQNRGEYVAYLNALTAFIIIMVLTFFSLELLHIYVIAGYSKGNNYVLESQYSKAGLTVLWAICSFALMWLGMKYREKTIRIISLVLFSIVLIKLALIDISGISEGGKILTFILLGVLLLIVSFMYQKLKKIIINDKQE